jgi:hypothetical protein
MVEGTATFRHEVSRGRGTVPPDADAAVWWIDDAFFAEMGGRPQTGLPAG